MIMEENMNEESLYAFVLTTTCTYAKPMKNVRNNEHVAGVYQSLQTAANAASKHAKHWGMKYIPVMEV